MAFTNSAAYFISVTVAVIPANIAKSDAVRREVFRVFLAMISYRAMHGITMHALERAGQCLVI